MQHQQERANISTSSLGIESDLYLPQARIYDQLLSAKLQHLLVSLNIDNDTNIAGPRIFKTFLETSKNIKEN